MPEHHGQLQYSTQLLLRPSVAVQAPDLFWERLRRKLKIRTNTHVRFLSAFAIRRTKSFAIWERS